MSGSATQAERLLDLVAGHRVTATLCSAVELGVIEALAAEPLTARELAAACSAHEPSLERLLRALVGIGVCRLAQNGQFQLTDMGTYLVQGAHPSLRDWTLFEGKMLARSWMGLSESMRTGRTAAELAGSDRGRYEEVGRDPQSAALFDAAMVSMTRLVARDILCAYDFRTSSRLLDVGGGAGALLIAILLANPTATGRVLDLPRCEAGARQAIADAGLESRMDVQAADFFAALPQGFDTFLLKSVLHNWDDARCTDLLANCRRALGPSGRLLVIERMREELPEASPSSAATALSDLNMLRGTGGRERSEGAYHRLMSDAGLRLTRVMPAGRYHVFIAEL